MSASPFRDLPSIRAVLDQPALVERGHRQSRDALLRAVRAAVAEARGLLAGGEPAVIDERALADRAIAILDADRPALRRVLNATGILLHTGLGRAPLATEAIEAVSQVARGYSNLELDLDRGDRGRRTSGVADLLCRLTGAEAATVVNNNAAATVIALRALAQGREVIVSRGQLVEIGGSFRLPEIFEVSGAKLREVGTTNRTRLSDYEKAIGPETAALLRVHASNYRIVGFTEDVPIADLTALARSRGLWSIDDVGSGALGGGISPLVVDEPTVSSGVAAGADLVLFSGDKLMGGPQAGLLVGSRSAVSLIESDPLMRAIRVDKMTLAALEATLRLALDPASALDRIPLWSAMKTPVDALMSRAEGLARAFRDEFGLDASAEESTAYLGGGSTPVAPIPTAIVRVRPPFPEPWLTEGAWASALRKGDPPVIPRVQGGSVLFDLRTLAAEDDAELRQALSRLTDRGRVEDKMAGSRVVLPPGKRYRDPPHRSD